MFADFIIFTACFQKVTITQILEIPRRIFVILTLPIMYKICRHGSWLHMLQNRVIAIRAYVKKTQRLWRCEVWAYADIRGVSPERSVKQTTLLRMNDNIQFMI